MNDAFGRLRISNPYTIFEYYPNTGTVNNDYDADIWISNGENTGAISYSSSENTISLTTSASGDKYTRETKMPMDYQPGKSRLLYMSTVPISADPGSENVTTRVGVFSVDSSQDIEEGHCLKINQNNIYITCAYNSTETDTIQSSWNIDTFDGNGPSGKTLNIAAMTKTILLVIDQEWLGVGRVRIGFNIEGVNYYAHQFISNVNYPYTSSPRLPIVYQIESSSNTTFTLKQMCCTCISEGGFIPLGRRIGLGSLVAGVDIPNNNEKYIVLGVKLKTANPKALLKLMHMDVLFPEGANNKWGSFEIQLHSSGLGDKPSGGTIGAVDDTITFSDVAKTGIQSFVPTGTLTRYVSTDGYILSKNFLIQKSNFEFSNDEYNSLLTRCIVTKYDTMYIVANINSGTNVKIAIAADFIESF